MAKGVVEEENGNACAEQSDDVRDHERPAAVFIGDAWETPDVSQTDGRADGGYKKAELASPLFTP